MMGVFGILEARGRGRIGGCDLRCCAGEMASEGDAELEARVLEFMEKSGNPKAFPTRKELEKAGRFDLVDAIRARGGWYALGWDSEQSDNEFEKLDIDFEIKRLRRRMRSSLGAANLANKELETAVFEDSDVESTGFDFSSESVSYPASSSGRLLEAESEEGSGIEGILSRLEKERNSSLGINIANYRNGDHASSTDDQKNQNSVATASDRTDLGMINSFQRVRPDIGRAWSIQRAGYQDTEFEADEIAFSQSREGERRISITGIGPPAENVTNDSHRQNGNNHYNIRSRLQHLEVELASALQLLSSKSEEHASREATEIYPGELQKLSDALEFQENELMNAQERLRALRAKLAVVEGKMTLAMSDSQKMVEAKQKRIDSANKALQFIRDVHIVWPSAASEVYITGSFDGWATQRKMEKSSAGIFSARLKLYPGRYEIKFIVDGEWRIDPLRPTTHSNGYENNQLIIT